MALCYSIMQWHYAEVIMLSAVEMSVILLKFVIFDDTHYTGFYYSFPECLYPVWHLVGHYAECR